MNSEICKNQNWLSFVDDQVLTISILFLHLSKLKLTTSRIRRFYKQVSSNSQQKFISSTELDKEDFSKQRKMLLNPNLQILRSSNTW